MRDFYVAMVIGGKTMPNALVLRKLLLHGLTCDVIECWGWYGNVQLACLFCNMMHRMVTWRHQSAGRILELYCRTCLSSCDVIIVLWFCGVISRHIMHVPHAWRFVQYDDVPYRLELPLYDAGSPRNIHTILSLRGGARGLCILFYDVTLPLLFEYASFVNCNFLLALLCFFCPFTASNLLVHTKIA